jgi:hypothetical protein
MLGRTIANDVKKTKSCLHPAAIDGTQQNVNSAATCRRNLTFGDSSENFVSDSEINEDEFGAQLSVDCGKFTAKKVAKAEEDAMRNATTPKLVVCDLDQNLLHNRGAESALLDTWMTWERGHRPLLLFHSARTVDELQSLLPSSVLPPPDFLIGGGTGMLVRHSFWNHDHSGDHGVEFAGFAPEHLLASMASKTLAQLNSPEENVASQFPKVENAVLTMAGLSVTFASTGKRARRSAPHAPLAWLLAQLKLDASEIRTYSAEDQVQGRRLNAAAR